MGEMDVEETGWNGKYPTKPRNEYPVDNWKKSRAITSLENQVGWEQAKRKVAEAQLKSEKSSRRKSEGKLKEEKEKRKIAQKQTATATKKLKATEVKLTESEHQR